MVEPTHLQYLAVNTMTNDECRERHDNKTRPFVYDGTLCAFAQKGQGACFTDSGNPLTSNGQLIGLAAWVLPCARGYPDAYTRISVFSNWIRKVSGIVAV